MCFLKTKLLSVIAAASIAVTSFAALAITASADDYTLLSNGEPIESGNTLHSGDVITADGDLITEGGLLCICLFYGSDADWIYSDEDRQHTFTLPDTYAEYTVIDIHPFWGDINLMIEAVPVDEVSVGYAQVGADYDPQFVGDTYASLWQVTVTPGDEAIESVGIKVTEKVSGKAGTVTGEIPVASGPIVFGVVVNGRKADIGTIAAIVNGVEVSPLTVE